LEETRSLAFLEQFFSSSAFHRCVEERGALPFAFAEFLADALAEGRLASPALPGVLALETLLARARRQATALAPPPEGKLQPAPGVLSLCVASGALQALQQAERYLFEVSLMPAMALCDDAPRLSLNAAALDRSSLYLVTVPQSGRV